MRIRSKTTFVLLFVLKSIIIWIFRYSKNVNQIKISKPPVKIVIGVVPCRKNNNTDSNVETTVVIKSLLISAKLYGVEEIDVHLFLEYKEDSLFFENTLKEFGFPSKRLNVKLFFYSAVEIVPEIYKPRLRCSFARLYFPHFLKDVDSILYFDTDFIITGNILSLWSLFDKMNDNQLVGVAPNNWPKLPVKYNIYDCFKHGPPFVKPKGLNADLLLMNLTRMRQYGWEEKITEVYKNYVNVTKVDDQVTLNILLAIEPDWLYLLPCHFNVGCSSCNPAMLCDDVGEDIYGIQCIHGVFNQFERGGRFYYIYKQYLEFDIRKHDVIKDLMIPIVNAKEPRSEGNDRKCDPTVNQYLFRNILKQNYRKEFNHTF